MFMWGQLCLERKLLLTPTKLFRWKSFQYWISSLYLSRWTSMEWCHLYCKARMLLWKTMELIQVFNAIALTSFNWTVETVFSWVQAEKYGTHLKIMPLSNWYEMEWSILRSYSKLPRWINRNEIHGHANVLQQLFGTICIVWLILGMEVKFG